MANKELKRLLKARMKSKDKGFVMDTFAYEDELNSISKHMTKMKKKYGNRKFTSKELFG